jgi:hypothetical protein
MKEITFKTEKNESFKIDVTNNGLIRDGETIELNNDTLISLAEMKQTNNEKLQVHLDELAKIICRLNIDTIYEKKDEDITTVIELSGIYQALEKMR